VCLKFADQPEELQRLRDCYCEGMHEVDEGGHRVTDSMGAVFWSHTVF
jgi:hypothetical protein